MGRFSIIYFRGLGLRIRVSVRARVWVRIGVGVRVSVVLCLIWVIVRKSDILANFLSQPRTEVI